MNNTFEQEEWSIEMYEGGKWQPVPVPCNKPHTGKEAYKWGISYFPEQKHPTWEQLTDAERAEYEQIALEIDEIIQA